MRHLKSNIEDQDIFQSGYKIKLSFSKVGTRMKEERKCLPFVKISNGFGLDKLSARAERFMFEWA